MTRTPRRLICILALSIAQLSLAFACSSDGDGPFQAVFEKQAEALTLLETHAEDPDRAASELSTWWRNNERTLRSLKTRLDALPKDDPQALADAQMAHRADIAAFNERLRRLRSRYAGLLEHEGVAAILAELEAL